MWLRRSGWVLALLVAGCELAEVTTPAGEDLLVVEAVLRAGAPSQTVLLHRTLRGGAVSGEPNARVSVRNPYGSEIVFAAAPLSACTEGIFPERTDSLAVLASCYAAGIDEGLVVSPGATYELRVSTGRGEEVRGRTRVPGSFQLRVPSPAPSGASACELPPGTNLVVTWSPSSHAWSYLAAAEILGLGEALAGTGIEAPDRLELTGAAVSRDDTTLVVPAEIGLFERVDVDQSLLRALQQGFPAGVSARLVVAAVDRNLLNGVRGGRFNPSGPVRISSVVGDGVGVFGAVVSQEAMIFVGRGLPYPSCRSE